ncbi:MAG: hypothetical protein QGF53_09300 [Alphaproteobacteria bacterium]|nr:hypothetical protein [Alphaproteobacteria bacterium]MDP6952943.1 hypothetical protein [Alphaproteobacteria bacterium]
MDDDAWPKWAAEHGQISKIGMSVETKSEISFIVAAWSGSIRNSDEYI